jgi:hypothetical protein
MGEVESENWSQYWTNRSFFFSFLTLSPWLAAPVIEIYFFLS